LHWKCYSSVTPSHSQLKRVSDFFPLCLEAGLIMVITLFLVLSFFFSNWNVKTQICLTDTRFTDTNELINYLLPGDRKWPTFFWSTQPGCFMWGPDWSPLGTTGYNRCNPPIGRYNGMKYCSTLGQPGPRLGCWQTKKQLWNTMINTTMAFKGPSHAPLLSRSYYMTCTSWVIIFQWNYGQHECQNQNNENRLACPH
jgi:hypothetical protein